MSGGNGRKIGPLLKMERRKAGITQSTISRLERGIWKNVNDALVAAGHAVYQEY